MGHNKIDNYTGFYYVFFRNILLVLLPATIIIGLVLSVSHSSAVNNLASDSVSVTLPASCTLSASGTDSHTTSMVSGQLKENIGLTEINTLCNDKDGYVIYAKGISQDGNNNVVLSSPIGSSYDIKTGNIPSADNNSSWAFKLNTVTGDYAPTIEQDYENKYMPIPNTWTKIVSKSSGTATNTDISDTAKSAFTTTYAIYTTPSQPAGTYAGQVQYVLLHPSTITRLATDINTAFQYANKPTVELTDPETGETGNFYIMQDMNSGICASVVGDGESTAAKLVDIRDNNLYYVTKLKDGNCWMTQNLALDLSTSTPLTSENTDLNDNSLSGAYATGYTYDENTHILFWRPGNNTTSFNGTDLSFSLSLDSPVSATKTDGTLYGHQATGNYYNFTAAIASSNSSSLTGGDANNSICPKGWRLPTTYANNDFSKLNIIYNSSLTDSDAGLIVSPLWLVRSGQISTRNSLNNFSTTGHYWAKTVVSDFRARSLYFADNIIDTNNDSASNRQFGRSLRCLAR